MYHSIYHETVTSNIKWYMYIVDIIALTNITEGIFHEKKKQRHAIS